MEQRWGTLKGYLRIEGDNDLHWLFDEQDSDEDNIRAQVKRIYMIADANGKVLEGSNLYQAIGFDSPARIKRVLASSLPDERWETVAGVPYLIRASYILNESRTQKYYVAIGISLANNHNTVTKFTWLCLAVIPLVIVGLEWRPAG